MIHELKIEPHYFTAVLNGEKKFEIRLNNRDFQKGDLLALREYSGEYTKRSICMTITYITNFQQKKDWCVLGIRPSTGKEIWETHSHTEELRKFDKKNVFNRLFLVEIMNDLHRNGFVVGGKADTMLRDWSRELKRETVSSFPRSRLREKFIEVMGNHNW